MSLEEDRLPSRPLRNWFLAWHIYTGDPPAVIAKGFGLDETRLVELIGGDAPLMMSKLAATELCTRTRLDPRLLWPAGDLTAAWLVEPYWEMIGLVEAVSQGR